MEIAKQHKKADSENQSPLGIRDDLLEKEKYVTRKGKEKTFQLISGKNTFLQKRKTVMVGS